MAKKIVWVLGAGFSAGLGGPLLTGLFTEASEADLGVRYLNRFPKLFDPAATAARRLYAKGSTSAMWSNPEDFMDYLDTAVGVEAKPSAPHPHFVRLTRLLNILMPPGVPSRPVVAGAPSPKPPSLTEVRDAARRILAAECSSFLEGVDIRQERWEPFRRWANGLTGDDTIISFNYDRVVEMLMTRGSAITVVDPSDIDLVGLEGRSRLLKLHGSVDWKKTVVRGDEVKVEITNDPHFALTCGASELAIATPGPSKMNEAKGLGKIWDLATEALKEAGAIVFLGYRFPETDAYARHTLLDAIGEHQVLANLATVNRTHPSVSAHIVLGMGPTSRDASARLASILTFVSERKFRTANQIPAAWLSVHAHQLFGQDFLTVVHRDAL